MRSGALTCGILQSNTSTYFKDLFSHTKAYRCFKMVTF